MAMKFRSSAGYHKWLAWGHMHGAFKKRGNQQVKIRGHKHKVAHHHGRSGHPRRR